MNEHVLQKNYLSHSLSETRQIAEDWLVSISQRSNESKGATIVGLSGHLGAGKTAFVKAVSEILGVKETVTSPTFVIMKIYETHPASASSATVDAAKMWHRIVHIDAYRLEKSEDLSVLGFQNIALDPHNLIMVEWPEQVGLNDFASGQSIAFEALDDGYSINIQ